MSPDLPLMVAPDEPPSIISVSVICGKSALNVTEVMPAPKFMVSAAESAPDAQLPCAVPSLAVVMACASLQFAVTVMVLAETPEVKITRTKASAIALTIGGDQIGLAGGKTLLARPLSARWTMRYALGL